jgi:hypothetical protein
MIRTIVSRAARIALVGSTLAGAGLAAQAADLNSIGSLSQDKFRLLSQDLGSTLSYKGLVPAEGLGIIGFDVGVGMTATKLKHADVFKDATSGVSSLKTLPLTSLRAHKGLPFNVDLGLAISSVPSTNIRNTAGEIRWAFVPGGIAMPALAVRASGSFLSGVDHLKLRTTGVDLSISKGFLMVTPYAGIGTVSVKSTPDAGGLKVEKFSQSKVFGGVNVNLGLANLAIETDKTGDATSYGLKVGFRF